MSQESAVEQTRRRDYQRPKFPLVLKLFLLTAGLIVVVVGASVGFTVRRADTIATTTVNKAIANAGKLYHDLEANRLRLLSLGIATLSKDVAFFQYVEEAVRGEQLAAGTPLPESSALPSRPPLAADEYVSLVDQLQQRKALLGSDLLILTDDEGVVLARSDAGAVAPATSEDMYETQPMVRALIDNGASEPLEGMIATEGRLYHAAAAPLSVGANRVVLGYLVNALSIDEAFATEIARTTQTEVIFVPAEEGMQPVRSSEAPSAGETRSMVALDAVFASKEPLAPATVELGGNRYVVTAESLGVLGKPLAAAVFVRSFDAMLAPFREIQRTLLFAGGIALLFAFALSWLIAKRLTRPIEELAVMAEAVTAGDYSVRPSTDGTDEVGLLATAFAQMISSLRDKEELEELYMQMSSEKAAAEAAAPIAMLPPRTRDAAMLVTDLRGIGKAVESEDPGETLTFVAHLMRVQEGEVRRQEGEVVELVGHRLVSVFEGERGVIHAIRAARAISEELSLQPRAKSPVGIGAGVSRGRFAAGAVQLGQDSSSTLIGEAPFRALLLAGHAPAGLALVTEEAAAEAGEEFLSAAKKESLIVRSLEAPLPVYSVPLLSMSPGVKTSLVTFDGTTELPTMKLEQSQVTTAPMLAIKRDLSRGDVFANRYHIDDVIGKGGMGIVYRAVDRQLDEVVAIKTLPGDALQSAPEELERFKREIRLARKITHRNVLRTYDYGEADGVYFISMEYVRGYTLSDLLKRNRAVAPRLISGIARQISRGLEAAHEQGIIHRDIKPQNVLIDHKGEVKLMDFGIAKFTEADASMTQQGVVVGTPHYMSPEQVQGKPLDPRSDVYSMGILLYELACGARPFNATTLTGVLTAHITERPAPPIQVRPEVGPQLSEIILRCLAKDPKQRYADGGELLAALEKLETSAAAA